MSFGPKPTRHRLKNGERLSGLVLLRLIELGFLCVFREVGMRMRRTSATREA